MVDANPGYLVAEPTHVGTLGTYEFKTNTPHTLWVDVVGNTLWDPPASADPDAWQLPPLAPAPAVTPPRTIGLSNSQIDLLLVIRLVGVGGAILLLFAVNQVASAGRTAFQWFYGAASVVTGAIVAAGVLCAIWADDLVFYAYEKAETGDIPWFRFLHEVEVVLVLVAFIALVRLTRKPAVREYWKSKLSGSTGPQANTA